MGYERCDGARVVEDTADNKSVSVPVRIVVYERCDGARVVEYTADNKSVSVRLKELGYERCDRARVVEDRANNKSVSVWVRGTSGTRGIVSDRGGSVKISVDNSSIAL